jgi:alkanesulfonate monooxygenase SsuD/methylene tetrahydromethanopterin reductase-like flavin-dependent oxidoreductase (luciferase family)
VVAVSVTLLGPPASLGSSARAFERAGVDGLWAGDYFQSGLVRATAIVAATERVRVGTHVLQAFARSPLATALAARELAGLSAGRFVLGLGSQVPAANRRWHGVEIERPVAGLGDYIAAVRALLDTPGDRPSHYEGSHFSFDVPGFRPVSELLPVPLWVGAASPASVRLAAGVADGLAGHLLWSYRHVQQKVRPAAGELPLSVARVAAARTVPTWRADLVRTLAHYLVTPAYGPMLAQQGVQLDRDALLDAVRSGDADACHALVAPYLPWFTVTDPDELAHHVTAAGANGVDEVVLVAPSDPANPPRTERHERELVQLISRWRAER